MIRYDIRYNSYYDSVTLMLISKEIKNIEGVSATIVGMGTDLNKELTVNLKLDNEQLEEISANDFYIAADVDSDEVMETVISKVNELLIKKKVKAEMEYRPVSLKVALEMQPDTNMVIVSIAGQYVEREVDKLLDNDLNVMLFSDNVSVESELKLKKKAVEKGLLMMGPDCGTAIINGVPLVFANVVRKGNIGVVGASGTGTQEVTCLIDQLGEGVSQVIGTGSRDLKSEIGGLMMMQGIKALMDDSATEVIVLISKPPAPEVAKKILELTKETDKPVVVDFIGGDDEAIKAVGAYPCSTLEDAARKAVALSKGEEVNDFDGFTVDEDTIDSILESALTIVGKDQKYLRGLYTGGTLADEAMKLLGNTYGGIYSNIPLLPEYELKSLTEMKGHVCLDLGEDQFTVGRPHPMIDPSTRTDRFATDIDEEVAVLLVDVVLGYGSHENPAAEVANSITQARETLKQSGKDVFAVASITGTAGDPQGLKESRRTLEDAGIVVMPSNAQAVRLVKVFLDRKSAEK
jgi:succinyl-CoA synthetase alpha subunit